MLRFHAAGMFLNRFFIVFFALAMLAGTIRSAGAAQAYIIVDSRTGHVLEERESKQKRQVGSLTKVATAMVVLDWAEHRGGNLNQVVSIPPAAFVGAVENNIGFQPGDVISLRDLLYAALVQSDNIAAFTLAAHVGSTIQSIVPPAAGSKTSPMDAFVSQMNALAKQLKMEKTRFVNPHGVDNNVKPMPFSTAEDMARVTRYAMNKAAFRFYVSQKERQISFQSGGRKRNYLLRNTNELVGTHGVDGVKTGRTARAGDCLILSVRRESEVINEGQYTTVYPRHLIVVLLASTNRFSEGLGMIARGWQLHDQWVAAGRLVDPQKVL
ncbi:MAG: serine hydrolase [Verrucomicrobiota bacterium]|nr:serine hydrolase [Verrucomicrobiota bacterium]